MRDNQFLEVPGVVCLTAHWTNTAADGLGLAGRQDSAVRLAATSMGCLVCGDSWQGSEDNNEADDSRIGIHLISVSKLLRILMPQRPSSFVRM